MDSSVSGLRRYIADFLVYRLGCPGRTMPQIRGESSRQVPQDASQTRYEHTPAWHTRAELLEYLGRELKVSPYYFGPDRKSADFYNLVDQEIGKLRRKKLITDWAAKNGTGIFRLSAGGLTVRKPVINLDAHAVAGADSGGRSLKEDFISILTKGRKANTYKFALARALIEYCKDTPYSAGKYEIPYSYLAAKFLEYYWHQEYKYRIKQDFMTESVPKVIDAIRRVFQGTNYSSFEDVSMEEKLRGRDIVLRTVFGHARSKTSLVVPRFQNVSEGSGSVLRKVFYDYDDDAKIVRLRPEAFEFFKNNHRILSMAVLAEWAKFLEKINKSLPMLVAKIEQDEMRREPLTKYKNLYLQHTRHCFYCGNRLEASYIHVDHFIPWSYIFEDQPWNLVLACRQCNLKKSASLPQEDFQAELIRRNGRYRGQIQDLDRSLRIIDTRLGWKKEIQNHYITCKEYGFGVIRLP